MSTHFIELCKLCEQLEKEASRNLKVNIVADFLRKISSEEVKFAVYFITGKFPSNLLTLNVGYSTIYQIIKKLSNISDNQYLIEYNKTGDMGETTKKIFEIYPPKTQKTFFEQPSTLTEVYEIFQKIAEFTGESARVKKQRLIESFLSKITPLEAKYFIKNLIGEMRHGFSEGLMEEAVAKAFNVELEKIRLASMVTGDLGKVCEILKIFGKDGVEKISLTVFRPIKPMLADLAKNPAEALIRHGGKTSFEFKLDGVRIQIHKKNSNVKIFSRRLKEVTEAFPEIVEKIKHEIKADSFVVEGEIIPATKNGKPLPFQYIMRRYGRVKNLEKTIKNITTTLYLFDLLYLDGEVLIGKPFYERRKKLEEIAPNQMLTPQLITSNPVEAEKFFEEAIKNGHEGLVAKQLESAYTPGIRGKKWLKIKKVLETLDLVILAAEYGHGYRHDWLSDYYLAAKNLEVKPTFEKDYVSFADYVEKIHNDRFKVVGKTFKGLTDEEIKTLTSKLKNLILEKHGRAVIVEPKIVVEVAYSEIQKSSLYSCGYALRFARIVRIREDKTVDEIDTIEKVKEIFEKQFKTTTSNFLER